MCAVLRPKAAREPQGGIYRWRGATAGAGGVGGAGLLHRGSATAATEGRDATCHCQLSSNNSQRTWHQDKSRTITMMGMIGLSVCGLSSVWVATTWDHRLATTSPLNPHSTGTSSTSLTLCSPPILGPPSMSAAAAVVAGRHGRNAGAGPRSVPMHGGPTASHGVVPAVLPPPGEAPAGAPHNLWSPLTPRPRPPETMHARMVGWMHPLDGLGASAVLASAVLL